MKRISLQCANCGGQDFEVECSIIPRAISISCNSAGCGRITPIAFFDETGKVHEINGHATNELYEKTFCEEVSPLEARKAHREDWESRNK